MKAGEKPATHCRRETVVQSKEKTGEDESRNPQCAKIVGERVPCGGTEFASDDGKDDHFKQ